MRLTNSAIIPGTLNVVLRHPLLLRPACGRRLVIGERAIWQAWLGDQRVWIHRWDHVPLHTVELLADIHLRQRFALSDGDSLCLAIDDGCCLPLRPWPSLIWGLAWQGRQSWDYTSWLYSPLARLFCRLFGASQRIP